VFVTTPSTPDHVQTRTRRRHICATSHYRQEPRELYLDADATLRAHVTSTVRTCFATLRQIRSVCHCLPRPALVSLLRALVISKVDYCSAVLAGSAAVLLKRLQSVLNAAARLVFSAGKSTTLPHLSASYTGSKSKYRYLSGSSSDCVC